MLGGKATEGLGVLTPLPTILQSQSRDLYRTSDIYFGYYGVPPALYPAGGSALAPPPCDLRSTAIPLASQLALLKNLSLDFLYVGGTLKKHACGQRKLFVFELFDFIYSNLCHCPAERVLGTSLPNGNVVLRCCRIRRIRDATQNEVASVLVYKTGGQQHWASLLLHI